MFTEIPTTAPTTPLLDRITTPADLKTLSLNDLEQLATELRAFLLYSVGQTGGHFGAGLGVVELTIALHFVLNAPDDDIIWDVGHQSYPHKILCGRRKAMLSMRQLDGLAPFPSREESKFDSFGVGHSSTSISAALGMAVAKNTEATGTSAEINGDSSSHTVAVIGDGAMTAGMAFEALNHAAYCKVPMLVILNDNTMSISANVGGFASYLENIWQKKSDHSETDVDAPSLSTANLFDDLGISYSGPVDGHDIKTLIAKIKKLLKKNKPCLLHIQTVKGKGFAPAVDDPVGYHALTKIEATDKFRKTQKARKYQDIFGDWICDQASRDRKLIAITPAMREGSGLLEFSKRFPERFHDVAIAEQHAVTFAAGLACKKLKPVVAIYSTFLQRAYDQVVHDVALQNLDVLFVIDRAGVVGEDGATHTGAFDISMLQCLPHFIIAAPSSDTECTGLLNAAYAYDGPSAVRYPRGAAFQRPTKDHIKDDKSEIGKAKIIREGKKVCLLNFGALFERAEKVSQANDFGLVDMRWIKPVDETLVVELAQRYDYFVSIEEASILGGAGSIISGLLQRLGLPLPLLQIGLPDRFIPHGKRSEVLHKLGLDAGAINSQISCWLEKLSADS